MTCRIRDLKPGDVWTNYDSIFLVLGVSSSGLTCKLTYLQLSEGKVSCVVYNTAGALCMVSHEFMEWECGI
jgi:hypothetical protein